MNTLLYISDIIFFDKAVHTNENSLSTEKHYCSQQKEQFQICRVCTIERHRRNPNAASGGTDRPFHNDRASKSIDRHFYITLSLSINEF